MARLFPLCLRRRTWWRPGLVYCFVRSQQDVRSRIKVTKKPRNKFEAATESSLKKSKVRFTYESERIPYVLARYYVPDFIVHTGAGKIYIECKGYLRPEHKAKMVAVKKQHPEKDIRILFYSKNSKSIRWAEKHGFIYAIGIIPPEWLTKGTF